MRCPNCSANLSRDARYCSQCGLQLQRPPAQPMRSEGGLGNWLGGLGTLMGTLMFSLIISLVLTAIFHFPIFILGAFLPLFWFGRRGTRRF